MCIDIYFLSSCLSPFFFFFFGTQLYYIKYSYLMQAICVQWYGFKYFYLKLIIRFEVIISIQ